MSISTLVKELKTRYSLGEKIAEIKNELKKYPYLEDRSAPILLCQATEDVFFLHRMLHFIIAYSKIRNTAFSIRWICVGKNFRSRPLKHRFITFLFRNRITDAIWLSPYKRLGGKLAFRYNSMSWSQKKAQVWANKTFSSLKSKEELVDLTLDGIVVGDLVYDTYLRFKPAPTVDLKDPFLLELLEWTFNLTSKIKRYLANHKIAAVVTTYTSYINHGLLVRIAADQYINVFALGVANQIVLGPTKSFPYHVRNFHKYKEFFEGVTNKPEAIEIGEKLISSRLKGQKDVATAYMIHSAYHASESEKKVLQTNGKPKAIIMAHDFYDSPHVYGKMLFPDFYEWVCFLFDSAKNSIYDVYYKPHPNGTADNNKINESLRQANPHITFLEKGTSNLKILEEGIAVAFTVHGTVAHEFAYLGVPVVSAAANPHSAYDFNICPTTREELADYITGRTLPNLKNSDVAEFCYTHNLRYIDNSLTEFPIFSEQDEILHLFDEKKLSIRVSAMIEAIKRCDSI